MERYTYLYGTNTKNVYCSMGCSEGLQDFLRNVGSLAHGITIDTVRQYINLHSNFAQNNSKLNSDVSLCYAPMYLKKLPNMPNNIKPFCAVGVSGRENIAGRESFYDETVFLPFTLMLGSIEENGKIYSYLDQIFGTKLLTWQEMRDHRLENEILDFECLPENVDQKLLDKDFPAVVNTLRAVINKKIVIIRLEEDCSFSKRAVQFLSQVYSLLHPKLAAETGFAAAFIDGKKIEEFGATTNVRIFVVPPEFDLNAIEAPDILKLDFNVQTSIPPIDDDISKTDALTKSIFRWASLTWPQRREAMEIVFNKENGKLFDSSSFINATENFFGTSFFGWLRETSDAGNLSSLQNIKALYDKFEICEDISWAKDLFKKKIASLGVNFNELERFTAEQYANLAWNDESARELAEFGCKMGWLNSEKACRSSAQLGYSIGVSKSEKEILQLKTDLSLKETEKNEAVKAAIEACEQKRIDDINLEAEKTRAAEEAHVRYVFQAEETVKKLKEEVENVKEEKDRAVQSAVEDCEARFTEQLNNVEQKANEKIKVLKGETNRLSGIIEAFDAEKGRAVQDAVEACSLKFNETLEIEKHKARQKIRELSAEKNQLKNTIEGLKSKNEQLRMDLDNTNQQYYNNERFINDAQKKYEEAQRLYFKAERKEKELLKQRLIFGTVGFVMATIIFGLSLVIGALFANKEEQKVDPAVEESIVEETPATTDEASELQPSSSATMTQNAPMEQKIDDALNNFVDLRYVDREMLESKLGAIGQIGGFCPAAVYSLDKRSEGVDELPENFVVLYCLDETPEADAEMTDMALPADVKQSAKRSEAVAEENFGTVSDSMTVSSEELLKSNGARIVFIGEKYMVAAFGDDKAVNNAIALFSYFTDKSQNKELHLYDYEGNDLAEILRGSIADLNIDNQIITVDTDKDYLEKWKNELAINAEPTMLIQLDTGCCVILKAADSNTAVACVEKIAGKYMAVSKYNYIIVNADYSIQEGVK